MYYCDNDDFKLCSKFYLHKHKSKFSHVKAHKLHSDVDLPQLLLEDVDLHWTWHIARNIWLSTMDEYNIVIMWLQKQITQIAPVFLHTAMKFPGQHLETDTNSAIKLPIKGVRPHQETPTIPWQNIHPHMRAY